MTQLKTRMIELRSDTFTLPSPAMLEAMVSCPLGDDVYGEDPTVRRLEEIAAGMLAKEAACLLPSGTMANLASIMAHAPRGSKTLVGDESDIYIYEAGGASVCGGVVYEPIPTLKDGRLGLNDLAASLSYDPSDPQFAPASLLCLEDTHNRCGGTALPLSYLDDVREFANRHGLAVHIDGARIFNAAIALSVPASRIAQYGDSVQFCLSKGLSAPIGSIVAGTAEFLSRVRRIRKMLGGGMRQAGVIAAAGIVALEEMTQRLPEDHANARLLAEGLAAIPGVEVEPSLVQTNIVMFRILDERFTWETFVPAAHRAGLAVGELGHGRIRAVTHSGVTADDIDHALSIVSTVLRNGPETYV